MSKKKFLKSLDNVYCRLKQSKYGVGVFAIRDIPKGTNPFIGCYNGEFIPIEKDIIDKLSDPIKEMIIDFCPFEDNKYYVPEDGLQSIDISFYLNHSKEPNMQEDEGGLNFFSARNIMAGEELTVDYRTYNDFNEDDPINKG